MAYKPKVSPRRVKKPAPKSPAKPVRKYRVDRDDEGLTPRQRLDALKADLAALELAKQRGDLVPRADVAAGHSEMREMVRKDMLGTLPLKLGFALADKAIPAREVREVALGIVREVLRGWAAGGVPVPE